MAIFDLTFINGYFSGPGGAIIFSGANLNLTNCIFENNSCTGSNVGGALYVSGYNYLYVWNSIFRNNLERRFLDFAWALFLEDISESLFLLFSLFDLLFSVP